jgi:hypothetical protein
VGLIVTNNFAVSDLYVFWDVCKVDKETCVGFRDIMNALKEASYFIAKTLFPKWLEGRVFHEGRLFHFFSSDWVKDCIGVMLLKTMVISQGDSHVGRFHVPKVVLWQISGRKIL